MPCLELSLARCDRVCDLSMSRDALPILPDFCGYLPAKHAAEDQKKHKLSRHHVLFPRLMCSEHAPNMLRTCSNISNPKVSLSTLRKCSLHCIHRWFSAKAPNAPARYVLWYSFQSHWGPEWPNVHPPEVWSPNPSPTFWVEGRQPPGMHLKPFIIILEYTLVLVCIMLVGTWWFLTLENDSFNEFHTLSHPFTVFQCLPCHVE